MENVEVITLDKSVSETVSRAIKQIELPTRYTAMIETILIHLVKECGKVKLEWDPNKYDHPVVINEYPVVSDHYVEETDTIICRNKKYLLDLVYKKLKITDLESGRSTDIVYSIRYFMLRPAGETVSE